MLASLIGRADVFVQNLAPGAAARMGLSAQALRARDDRLIVVRRLRVRRRTGRIGDRRAYDLLIQCETGLLSVTGTPDAPAKAGISVADIAGGMYAFSSILAALYARERTGDGAAPGGVAVRVADRVDGPAHVLRDVHRRSPGPHRHQPRDHRALRGVPHRRRAAGCSCGTERP